MASGPIAGFVGTTPGEEGGERIVRKQFAIPVGGLEGWSPCMNPVQVLRSTAACWSIWTLMSVFEFSDVSLPIELNLVCPTPSRTVSNRKLLEMLKMLEYVGNAEEC